MRQPWSVRGLVLLIYVDYFIIREKSGCVVKNKQGIEGAARLFRAQLIVMFVVSIAAFLVSGLHASISILLGGLVSALPNVYFARMLFRHHGAMAASKIVNSFYKGEAMKMLLTISLFALTFKYLNIVPLVFIVGFIAVQLVFWFAPLIFDNKRK